MVLEEDFQCFFPSYKSMGALCFPLPDESLQEISSLLATDIRDYCTEDAR